MRRILSGSIRPRGFRLKKRTVPGKKYGGYAVLFFVGLLLFQSFSGGEETGKQKEEGSGRSRYTVVRESMAGREEVPLEEYLIGALAGSVPDDFEPQACRAQAVILRTNVIYAAQQEGTEAVTAVRLKQESLTFQEMREKWGGAFEEQYGRLKEAVKETEGQILLYEGTVVELPFFPLSSGKTRQAGEVWQDQETPYLESVSCQEDIFAPQYEQEVKMGEGELEELLGELFGAESSVSWEETAFLTDSAGYVTALVWKEKEIPGEVFRERAGLASSCFTMEKDGDSIWLITKGIGHGLGMSQYTANAMAKEGKAYREILTYFFPACEIMKN